MIFDGGIFLFEFEPWNRNEVQHQVPESSGPPLTIYHEKFHLSNRVIKFP